MDSSHCFGFALLPMSFIIGSLFGATKGRDKEETDVILACIIAAVFMTGFLGAGIALKTVGQ